MSKMGLHQIARLHHMLRRWRRRAASNADPRPQTTPPRSRELAQDSSSSGRLSSPSSSSSSACAGAGSRHRQELPPAGYLAIYVGRERRRFEITTEHINHPLLRGLLQRTEEEFGLNSQGGLAIPACEVVMFEHMLWMVDNQETGHLFENPAELRELLDFYMQASAAASCLQEAGYGDPPAALPISAVPSCYSRLP